MSIPYTKSSAQNLSILMKIFSYFCFCDSSSSCSFCGFFSNYFCYDLREINRYPQYLLNLSLPLSKYYFIRILIIFGREWGGCKYIKYNIEYQFCLAFLHSKIKWKILVIAFSSLIPAIKTHYKSTYP